MRTQLLRRWKFESCEGQQGIARNTFEVMTDDQYDQHVCYVTGQDMAQHLVDLHNRTLGDGQEPRVFPPPIPWMKGLSYAEESYTRSGTPRWAPPTEMQPGRPALRAVVHVDVRRRVEQLIHDLVQERVTAYAAREPARLVIDGDPVAMANVLSKLGYTVFAPDHVFEGTPTAGVPVDTETLISILERRGYQVAQKVSPE